MKKVFGLLAIVMAVILVCYFAYDVFTSDCIDSAVYPDARIVDKYFTTTYSTMKTGKYVTTRIPHHHYHFIISYNGERQYTTVSYSSYNSYQVGDIYPIRIDTYQSKIFGLTTRSITLITP